MTIKNKINAFIKEGGFLLFIWLVLALIGYILGLIIAIIAVLSKGTVISNPQIQFFYKINSPWIVLINIIVVLLNILLIFFLFKRKKWALYAIFEIAGYRILVFLIIFLNFFSLKAALIWGVIYGAFDPLILFLIIRKRKNLLIKTEKDFKILIFLAIALIILLSLSYLADINKKIVSTEIDKYMDICRKLDDSLVREYCYMGVANGSSNADVCYMIFMNPGLYENCFENIAIAHRNIEYCDKCLLCSEEGKDYCYSRVAEKKNDISICNLISTTAEINDCYERIAITNKDQKICELIDISKTSYYRDWCYRKIAISSIDQKICEKIQDSDQSNGCKKDVIKETNESNEKKINLNISDCDNINQEQYRELCYKKVAIIKKDSSICLMIDANSSYSTVRDRCSLLVAALIAENPQKCSLADGTYTEDECLDSYAKETMDISACNLKSNIRNCYSDIYLSLSNENKLTLDTCNLISDKQKTIKDSCITYYIINKGDKSENDISFCENLTDSGDKGICYMNVMGNIVK